MINELLTLIINFEMEIEVLISTMNKRLLISLTK
jgi:hypothetical protein